MGKQYELFRLADGFYRIYIFQPDHNPPHIHLKDTAGRKGAIIEIESLVLVVNEGFRPRELNYVRQYLEKRRSHILERWREIQEQAQEDTDGD